jgi:hypothetical protein
MMIPAEYNISVIRGGTFELPISIEDEGGAVDLEATYAGARMHVRKAFLGPPVVDVAAPDPLLTLLSTGISPKLELDGVTLYIRLTAAETAALSFGSAVYDIELYSGLGASEVVDKLIYGKFTVGKEATI